jgi:hypothetical protein
MGFLVFLVAGWRAESLQLLLAAVASARKPLSFWPSCGSTREWTQVLSLLKLIREKVFFFGFTSVYGKKPASEC